MTRDIHKALLLFCIAFMFCVPAGLCSSVNFELPDGLVWFNPTKVIDATLLKPLMIDAVFFDNVPISIENFKVIPSNIQTIRFDFVTSFWGNSDNLILEYRLDGYNKKWLTVRNSQQSIEFSNLQSGQYTLQIRKHAGFGNANFIEAKLPFYVEKQFYEQVWFLFLCALLGVSFTIMVARLYADNIKKRNIVLEHNVQQRTLELSKANQELHHSVTVKDKLITIISHDIVTPLKFITMVARTGGDKNSTLDKEKIQNALFDIKNTSEKLHDNAQNILNWIKYQNKRIVTSKNSVAIGALAEEIAELFKEIAASKGTKIENNISHDDIIKTDKNIISIILHNLVSNAAKFTRNGSILIYTTQDTKNYKISIEDSGNGINAVQLQRIKSILKKEQIQNVNLTSGENGNGLGYVIISELIELLKGSISIESTLEKGTKVTVELPV